MACSQQLDELFDRRVGGNRHNFRTRLHRLAHRLLAEFHDRLDQVAIAFVQNAFFLASLDERIHGFRLSFGLFVRVLFGQRRDRPAESRAPASPAARCKSAPSDSGTQRDSHAPSVREKKRKGRKRLKQDDDENQA